MAEKKDDGVTKTPGTVTEDDLLKSIKALETKVNDEAAAKEPDPSIKTAALEKNAASVVKDGASDELKKMLDASDALTEIVTLIGAHVDNSLDTLAKSIQAGADRDLAFTRVLSDLNKSVGALGEKIEKYGEQPTDPASKTPPTATREELLTKSKAAAVDPAQASQVLRKQITSGLEKLAKSAQPGSEQALAYTQKAITFETTGQIDDVTFAEVKALYPGK